MSNSVDDKALRDLIATLDVVADELDKVATGITAFAKKLRARNDVQHDATFPVVYGLQGALLAMARSGTPVPAGLLDAIHMASATCIMRLEGRGAQCACEACTAKRKAGHAAMH